jgi:hypothetical protein
MTCCFAWIWNLLSHVKEEDSLRVSENRPLRRILGSVDRRLENFHKMKGLIFYSCVHIIRISNQGG